MLTADPGFEALGEAADGAEAVRLARALQPDVILKAGGSTNREAAARPFVSEATVRTHLLHIYSKLGVSDRAVAVAGAFNRGLLTPSTKRP